MTVFATMMLAAMASSDAIAVLLNSPSAASVERYEQARSIVERDAAAGKPLQQFVIGVTTRDEDLAKRYVEASRDRIMYLAEKTGNPLAWYLLAVEKNDIQLLRKAADGGNVQALNALGTIVTQEALKSQKSLSTNAIERILAKSFGYFRAAALQKDPNGLVNLGTCYLAGLGCEQNMSLAFDCFKAAAESGHPESMDNLSACYELGHGVKKDSARSLFWRIKARALRGDKSARKWLEGKQ